MSQQRGDNPVNYPLVGVTLDQSVDYLDAKTRVLNEMTNVIELDDGRLAARPAIDKVLTSITSLSQVTLAWGSQDFDIPDSAASDTAGRKRIRVYIVLTWNGTQHVFYAFYYDYSTKTIPTTGNTGGTQVVKISEVASDGVILGRTTAVTLCNFAVKGFKYEALLPVLYVGDNMRMVADTSDTGEPFIAMSNDFFPECRPLLFQFIERRKPFPTFGRDADAEAFWYFSPDTYVPRELNVVSSQWATLTVTEVEIPNGGERIPTMPIGTYYPPETEASSSTGINLPAMPPEITGKYPHPSGAYECGLFIEFTNGETFGPIATAKATNQFRTWPFNCGFQITITVNETNVAYRPRDVQAFRVGVKFTPTNEIGLMPQWVVEALAAGSAGFNAPRYQEALREQERILAQQKADAGLFSGWDDWYEIKGSRVEINANAWNNGATFSALISTPDPKRCVIKRGKAKSRGNNQVVLLPYLVQDPTNGFIPIMHGAYKFMNILLWNDTTSFNCYISDRGAIAYRVTGTHPTYTIGEGIILRTIDNPVSQNDQAITAGDYNFEIGSAWFKNPSNEQRLCYYFFNDIVNQVDRSKVLRDFRKDNAQPRSQIRMVFGKRHYVADAYNEINGQQIPVSVSSVIGGMRSTSTIYFTTPDDVSGVMRKRYFLGSFDAGTQVKAIQMINVVTGELHTDVGSDLIVFGTDEIKVYRVSGESHIHRKTFRGYSCASQDASVVINDKIMFADDSGGIFIFDGINDPTPISHGFEAKVTSVLGADSLAKPLVQLSRCLIDKTPFVIVSYPVGVTIGASPSNKSRHYTTLPTASTASTCFHLLYNIDTKGWSVHSGKATSDNFVIWRPAPDINGELRFLGNPNFGKLNTAAYQDVATAPATSAIDREIETPLMFVDGTHRSKYVTQVNIDGSSGASAATVTLTNDAGVTQTFSSVTLPAALNCFMRAKGVKVKISLNENAATNIRQITFWTRDMGGRL